MKKASPPPWPLADYRPGAYREAVALQEEWRGRVILSSLSRPPRLVAGVDAAYDKKDRLIFVAAVLYAYPKLTRLEEATAQHLCSWPTTPWSLVISPRAGVS